MNRLTRLGGAVLATLFLASCAGNSFTSYEDPAYAHVTYESIAIWANTSDADWRNDLETRMQQRVSTETGTSALRSIDLAPQAQALSRSQFIEVMSSQGVEAVVVLDVSNSGVAHSADGVQYGFYVTHSPWSQVSVDLFDVETGARVWTGIAKTKADKISDWAKASETVGNQVITALLDDGLLPPLQN